MPTSGASIKSAALLPALPVRCPSVIIIGAITPVDKTAPDINFQVSVPTLWNQKSWHAGGGGTNGIIPAVVANPGRGGVFGINPPTAPPLLAEGYAISLALVIRATRLAAVVDAARLLILLPPLPHPPGSPTKKRGAILLSNN